MRGERCENKVACFARDHHEELQMYGSKIERLNSVGVTSLHCLSKKMFILDGAEEVDSETPHTI